MKKSILALGVVAISTAAFAQKNELTDAAIAMKSVNPAKVAQGDEGAKKSLLEAKSSIDEALKKHDAGGNITKSKDIAKLYYYTGQIYMSYSALAMTDEAVKKELESDEAGFKDKVFGSFKKSLEANSYYEEEITAMAEMGRAQSINSGVEMFGEEKYKEAFGMFQGAVELYDVLGKVDTLAMFNAGLAADNSGDYENAIKYYHMAAKNNYTNSASPYQNLFRAIDKKNNNEPSDETLVYLEEAKAKYPSDIALSIEEFNYYNLKGDAAKAQSALETAIAKDPKNPIYQYSFGTTFDKMAMDLSEEKKYDEAETFFAKAKEAYQAAIDLDPNFVDAYFNMGALYNNQSYNISEKISEIQDMKLYDAEKKKADGLLNEAVPFLEKANELAPTDANTLKLLKTIYFTLELEDKYAEADAKLKALGQ